MDVSKLHNWALAAIPGGLCMAFGVIAAVVSELDYRGLAEATIPFAASAGITAAGAILLMIAFTGIRRLQEGSGTTGYWIGMAGLVLSIAPIWPLIIFGPMLLGIGLTIYGGSTLAVGSLRSLGSWLHVLSIPASVASGFAFFAGGFDGGLGMIVFMAMVIAGFMILGFDAAGVSKAPRAQETAA